MLSQQTIDLVKATAPILAQHGEALTKHFYKRMFAHNPEVKHLFNTTNQGTGNQQRALAGAITAFAGNVDNVAALAGAVELIAHKHASLTVKPEHYPIVGENLLHSIREVLGEAATDDIINAWAEAYGFLADILIRREQEIYGENAQKHGGWNGFKKLRVSKKVVESDNITSFYLTTMDGLPLPEFKAGQYITIRASLPDGTTTMRNYSLSDKADQPHYRISVKRELAADANAPAGYVSNLLHDECHKGDTIEVGPPCGEFVLNETQSNAPLVLLAGGVGITPVLSMLLTALEAQPDRPIIMAHAAMNTNLQAFRQTLDELASTHPNLTIYHRYSQPESDDLLAINASEGFIDGAFLGDIAPDDNAEFYFCGPKSFMVNLYLYLVQRGIPLSQVHFEFFGPREELEAVQKAA